MRQYWPPNGITTNEYPAGHEYDALAVAGTDFLHWRKGAPNGTTMVTSEYPDGHEYDTDAVAAVDLRQYWPPKGILTSEYPAGHEYDAVAVASTDR